jgi:hypothetical protein
LRILYDTIVTEVGNMFFFLLNYCTVHTL